MMRPTLSTSLYVQAVGRATRLFPGKENALILDFAGNVRRHGPVDAVSILPKGGTAGEDDGKAAIDSVRAKECPDCENLVAINASRCPHCDHEWPRDERPKHDGEADASSGILTSEKVTPQMLPVVDWQMKKWSKPGSPDTVRVDHLAGLQRYPEWICPEHDGYAGRKAAEWWTMHGGSAPFPKTADEAIERSGELIMPQTISVSPNGKFWNIVGRSFAQREAA